MLLDYLYYANCLCECGKEKEILLRAITTKKTLSCGCLVSENKKFGNQNKSWTGYGEISGSFFKNIRNKASQRCLEFSISIEYIWELFLQQNRKCVYTNYDLYFGSVDNSKTTTASLDRIDSSKGYIEGNVQWVHKTVNKMKLDLDEKVFLEICCDIYLNIKEKNE